MATKIWHPKHGFVFSGDDAEIKCLLESGGEIYIKKVDVPHVVEVPAKIVKPEPVKQKDGRPATVRRTRHYDHK